MNVMPQLKSFKNYKMNMNQNESRVLKNWHTENHQITSVFLHIEYYFFEAEE